MESKVLLHPCLVHQVSSQSQTYSYALAEAYKLTFSLGGRGFSGSIIGDIKINLNVLERARYGKLDELQFGL